MDRNKESMEFTEFYVPVSIVVEGTEYMFRHLLTSGETETKDDNKPGTKIKITFGTTGCVRRKGVVERERKRERERKGRREEEGVSSYSFLRGMGERNGQRDDRERGERDGRDLLINWYMVSRKRVRGVFRKEKNSSYSIVPDPLRVRRGEVRER